jgi:hypothetical protein
MRPFFSLDVLARPDTGFPDSNPAGPRLFTAGKIS